MVAEQLIDADTDSIIFVIPKGSVFSQSLNNFKLLKREGSVLGKEIIIESEDPIVQEKAVKAGLEIGEGSLGAADIANESVAAVSAQMHGGRLPRGRSLRVRTASDDDEEPVRRIARVKKRSVIVEANDVVDAEVETPPSGDQVSSRGEPVRPVRKHGEYWSRKRITMTSGAVLIAIAAFYVAIFVLPRANASVEVKKDSWNFNGAVVIDKSIAKVDAEGGKIPGQVFTQKNTGTVKLPASGKQFIERKASGELTVYNAYSSQPQGIVASTRFVTPSGVVFRITKALVIPGAKIENGKIIPSSVTAEVVADKAGIAGNLAPTMKLTIPGFIKTPKYNGFYGELKDGTTGGFSGETRVATENDVKAAKAEGARSAEEAVRGQIAGQIPPGFKTADGATRFTIAKQGVDTIADADGNFSVTTDAQLSVFAFREQDLKELLAERIAAAKGVQFKIDTEILKYGPSTSQGTASLSSGRVSLPIEYTAALSHVLDVDALRQAIAGKSDKVLNTTIFGTPGITGGNVSLWPFYVKTVPKDLDKITITVK